MSLKEQNCWLITCHTISSDAIVDRIASKLAGLCPMESWDSIVCFLDVVNFSNVEGTGLTASGRCRRRDFIDRDAAEYPSHIAEA